MRKFVLAVSFVLCVLLGSALAQEPQPPQPQQPVQPQPQQQPAKPAKKEAAQKPDKSAEKAADKSAEKAADKSAEKAADKSAEKAADKSAEKAADKSAEKAAAKARAGEVISIDATKNEIVVKDENDAELHLLIGTSTKITRDGKALAIADVKAGDKLLIDCEGSAEGCKAKSIQVAVPPPPQ